MDVRLPDALPFLGDLRRHDHAHVLEKYARAVVELNRPVVTEDTVERAYEAWRKSVFAGEYNKASIRAALLAVLEPADA